MGSTLHIRSVQTKGRLGFIRTGQKSLWKLGYTHLLYIFFGHLFTNYSIPFIFTYGYIKWFFWVLFDVLYFRTQYFIIFLFIKTMTKTNPCKVELKPKWKKYGFN